MSTQKHSNTCFGTYLYFAGTQIREPASIGFIVSRVPYFILLAHTGICVSHS